MTDDILSAQPEAFDHGDIGVADAGDAERRQRRLVAFCVGFGTIAWVLNQAPDMGVSKSAEKIATMLTVQLALAAFGAPMIGLLLRRFLRSMVMNATLLPTARDRYLRYEARTYLFALFPVVGAVGLRLAPAWYAAMALGFVLAQTSLLLHPPRSFSTAESRRLGVVSALFLVSGFAALIYQVSWQRVLFTAFGVNIESITIVVSLFMCGLGVGAMLGGVLSERFPDRLAVLFLVCELAIGAFGVASLKLIAMVSDATVEGSLLTMSVAIYGLLAIPTLFMGATLPILVTHLHKTYRHIGRSMGLLYAVNTVGSGLACFITTDILFVLSGLQNAVAIAAVCNLLVGVAVFLFMVRTDSPEEEVNP